MKHVTQKDIAQVLGVSRITVSKALREGSDISLVMREKVKHAAKELGYIPNYNARSLHTRRTNTIGVVVPDVCNSFFSYAIHGIMQSASKYGYHVMLTVSWEHATTEKENILALLSMRVDGLLVAISKETLECEVFDSVKRMAVPLVFFDRALEGTGFSSVGIDDRKAAADVVECAIRSGYRRIAHLAGSSAVSIGRDRRQGYLDVLKKYNIPVREEWIIEGGFDHLSGYNGFRKLYRKDDPPEVVFAANDRIAQGAYKAIRELRLKIPEDIGVIALGHSEFAEILSPPLTIADCPPDILGQRAMELLVSEIVNRGRNVPQHVILETVLRMNGSLLMR